MIIPAINNIAEICARKNVKKIILSPGSRCAPLTIAFVRHPEIEVKTISDERSAAFIGLGIAQQLEGSVGLLCTSGSAAYNYAPAVAEAFFQQIPLIIFTADRPPEWIDQLDGQTIRQREIFGKHVKKSYELPVSFEHQDSVWHAERIISEAIITSNDYPKGPVHINIPLREPFYPNQGEEIFFAEDVKIIEKVASEASLNESAWEKIVGDFGKYKNTLIVAGQNYSQSLIDPLNKLTNLHHIPIVADILTNLHGIEKVINHHDSYLDLKNENQCLELQPDLLITCGLSVISKNIKLLLRKYKPREHWHIQLAGDVADTFQSLTKIINVSPEYFFGELINKVKVKNEQEKYFKVWRSKEEIAKESHKKFFSKSRFGEFEAVFTIMNSLPEQCQLHLANSMAVRYANFIGLGNLQKEIKVFANRGTSGIDGSNSTAYGAALVTNIPVVLLTGDMAFFYDRNAFWNNYLPENLRIVILNNHAGGIFRMIEGPSKLPELEEFFETRQILKAESTAKEFGLDYLYCAEFQDIERLLPAFFKMDGKAKILEIETGSKDNKEILEQYKKVMKEA
jgi:2-succinyl-5-enolpyruvyl-6-hydroxy-3-cyclohexene-1-carboxylate synthase